MIILVGVKGKQIHSELFFHDEENPHSHLHIQLSQGLQNYIHNNFCEKWDLVFLSQNREILEFQGQDEYAERYNTIEQVKAKIRECKHIGEITNHILKCKDQCLVSSKHSSMWQNFFAIKFSTNVDAKEHIAKELYSLKMKSFIAITVGGRIFQI